MTDHIQSARDELAKEQARLIAEEQKLRDRSREIDKDIRSLDRIIAKRIPPLEQHPAMAAVVTRLKPANTGKPRGKRSPITGDIIAAIRKSERGELSTALIADRFNRSTGDIMKIMRTAKADGLVNYDSQVDLWFTDAEPAIAAE